MEENKCKAEVRIVHRCTAPNGKESECSHYCEVTVFASSTCNWFHMDCCHNEKARAEAIAELGKSK